MVKLDTTPYVAGQLFYFLWADSWHKKYENSQEITTIIVQRFIQCLIQCYIVLGLPGLWSSVPKVETGAPKLQNVSTGRVKITRESN
jgi:hypothetical protein